MKSEYDIYLEKLSKYPFNSEKMCNDFLELFNKIIKQKDLESIDIKVNPQKKYLFLVKNIFLKYFRKMFSLNLKSYLIYVVKKIVSK